MFTKIKWKLRSLDEFSESCFGYAWTYPVIAGDAFSPHLLPAGDVSNSYSPLSSWTARASETAEQKRKRAVPVAQKPERAWMIDPRDLGVYRKGNIAAQVMGTHKVGVHGACPISRASRFSLHLREDPEVREEAGLVEDTEKFRRPDEDHANYHTLFKNSVGYLPGI